jgi:hypothetical protein
MRENNIPIDDYEDSHQHRVRYFNKEKFCKKNKLGHGQYGPHIYVNDRCKFCNKIDPRVKHINYEELKNG